MTKRNETDRVVPGRPRRWAVGVVAVLALASSAATGMGAVADDAGPRADPTTVPAGAPDGALAAQLLEPTPTSLWIPAAAVASGTSGLTMDFTSGCVTSSVSAQIVFQTDVELPDGAEMQSMELAFFDEDSSTAFQQVQSFLMRQPLGDVATGGGPVTEQIWRALSSDTGWGTTLDDTSDTVGGELVDNQTYAYLLGGAVTPDESFCGVEIVYLPAAGDVVHTVTPCPIYDSRTIKGGPGDFASNEERTIDVIRPDYSGQGGDASDCGIPATARGLVIAVEALNSPTDGNLRVWPAGAPRPSASVLAFTADTMGTVSIPIELGDGESIRIRNGGASSTSIRLTVLGYLRAPG